ncbi:MAG TPA: MMPL family transporter, partial [Conexibacter sp.]|nr:MMPL family transporter [Conexibacter sp.]
MTALLHRLGAFCARRHRIVLVAWLLLAIGLGTLAGRLGTQTNDNATLPGTDSQRAADVLERDFPAGAENGTNPIVLRATGDAKLTDARERAVVEKIAAAYARDPAVKAVVSPFEPAGAAQIGRADKIAYLSLTLRDGPA